MNPQKNKIGIIDVGGGLRAIFGCGVFDYCLDHQISFSHCIGISAGSANLGAFLAGQPRRNLKFYMNYAFRPDYMSLNNLIRHGDYINLDYIYGTLTNEDGEYPLDYDAMMKNPSRFTIVASNADTGEVRYFEKEEIPRNHYDIFKASCCMPVINHPYPVGERLYYDGGIADPIPINFLLEEGCSKVIVVLTNPKTLFKNQKKDTKIAKLLKPKYPASARALELRALRYNKSLRKILDLEKSGTVLILAPEDIRGMKTLKKDRMAMMNLYLDGYHQGKKIQTF